MTKAEKISEGIGYVFIVVFAMGWIDFGQGPDLTWWKLIHFLGN
jgi:hypothetical protein